MPNDSREYSIRLTIDGEDIPNSYKDLQKAQRGVKTELKGLEVGTDQYIRKSQQLKQINKRMDEVRKDINKVGTAWKKQQVMWSRAKAVFAGAFAAFTVQGAIGKIQQLGGQLVQFVKNLTKQRREITRLTDVTGRDLDVVSAKIDSIVRTYNQDFNKVLISSNALAKAMGITHATALELIKDGFEEVGESSDEYLDILREYPAQFMAAGLTAQQSIAIISQQIKEGVYSDKGVDTIKEGTLRLREMTKATREALEAIGISSTDLEQKLRSNTMSYFDAIQMVSRRLSQLEAQSPEVGTAIADIFGGPGEDAGLNYIKTLGTVQTELEKTETATSKLAEANERLALAYQGLSDDDGILTNAEIMLKNLAAGFLDYVKFYGPIHSQTIISSATIPSSQIGIQPPPQTNNLPDVNKLSDLSKAARIKRSTVQATDGPLAGPDIDAINAEIDSIEHLIDMAPDVHAFWKQMELDTGESHDQLEEVIKQYGEEFEDAYQKAVDADTEFSLISMRNADERMEKRKEEIAAAREGFSMLAASTGTVFGQISRLQDDQTKSGIKNAAYLANAQIVASNVAVLANQAAALSEAVKGAAQSASGTGPGAILTIGPFIAAMLATVLGTFASIKETNSAARDKLSDLQSFNTGGWTGYGDMGYGSNAGGYVRGTVEEGEYVLNRRMLQDPHVANVARYVEASKKYGSSASGSGSDVNVNSTATLEDENFRAAVQDFRDIIHVLMKEGIPAKLYRNEFKKGIDDYASKGNASSRGRLG